MSSVPLALRSGELAAWVSAVATVFALVLALIAAIAARRAYLIEIGRDRVNEKERQQRHEFTRRAQAALVSAWWGSTPGRRGNDWGAFVRNASETPVYQANLAVVNVHDPDVNERFDLPVIPPAPGPSFHPIRVDGARHMTPNAVADYRVEMTFSDSTGNRWMRDQHGRLFEVRPDLVIWADTQRTDTLDRYTDEFLASHQVRVRFETRPIETLRRAFLTAAASGQTPDILVGPHDWIGGLVRREVIEPVVLTPHRRAAFVDWAIDAMTHHGQLYGVPYAGDSIGLLRNLDLAPLPPATVEEMIAHGRELCAAGRAEMPLALQVGTGDAFYVYPFFTSAGGRLFRRRADGGWDLDDLVGAGATAAFRRLRALGEQGEGILQRAIDRDRAMELFLTGRTPYLVGAPWAIGEARRVGIRLAVSPVPGFADGGPARSLVAVHGFYLSSTSANKSIAQDLIGEYLTRTDLALALYAAQPRTPALRNTFDRVRRTDPSTAVFHEQCMNGDLIPSGPDVGPLFKAFHEAECDVVAGGDVEGALRRLRQAVADINDGRLGARHP
ncbi:extracellular solute-binding protein [Micromonospora sp. WMMC241]|uniref:sugar ABC transporter substrate-binding protein n=1 Tax=Micromonospora sp. WMMC241 TaxID=3015159 RepID=UPI0022B65366|nr:extracellular solute-binding protein [Micromonospora sp. WMMC241]MCZ7436823.1 extracellular solute-binding protein [Micromonospora sp. WMMC241]